MKRKSALILMLSVGGLGGSACASYGSYLAPSEQSACKAYGDVLNAQIDKVNNGAPVVPALRAISEAASSASKDASTDLKGMLNSQQQDISSLITSTGESKANIEKAFSHWNADVKILANHCNSHGWSVNLLG